MQLESDIRRMAILVVLGASTSFLLARGSDEPIVGSPTIEEKPAEVAIAAKNASPVISARIKDAITHVGNIEITLAGEAPAKVLKACEHPLLSFGDPARGNEAGTLWAWSDGGRPVAMMELFRRSDTDTVWISAWTLTSTELVSMTLDSRPEWTPAKSDFALQDFSDSATVSDRPLIRLRQMKDMVRPFESHEFWDPGNSRFELRCLETPVLRYSDEKKGIIDGCVFAFAHGTNPEILLFVEAHGTSPEMAKWQFAAFRLGSAEMHLEVDEKTLWSRDRAPGRTGTPNEHYWVQIMNRDTPGTTP